MTKMMDNRHIRYQQISPESNRLEFLVTELAFYLLFHRNDSPGFSSGSRCALNSKSWGLKAPGFERRRQVYLSSCICFGMMYIYIYMYIYIFIHYPFFFLHSSSYMLSFLSNIHEFGVVVV